MSRYLFLSSFFPLSLRTRSYVTLSNSHPTLPSSQVDDFKAKYEAISVAYPVDAGNKLAVAADADAEIKAIAAEVVQEVDAKCAGSKKDIAFFGKLPAARSMTYEMYLELFPNASSVVPKEREQLEAELAEANAALEAHKSKKA